MTFQVIKEIEMLAGKTNLKFHLDGARLFNALVERKETAKQYGETFDSISICISKGLGCPVGSVLMCKKISFKKARRVRKVFGGGMSKRISRGCRHLCSAESRGPSKRRSSNMRADC
jgi:threonine aldolase